MNNERGKAKKRVVTLFISYLCIALICFGIFACLAIKFRGTEAADERLVNISKIFVLAGIFFLVLAFGYILPALIAQSKKKDDLQENKSDIAMRQALEKYIPDGETMLAGVRAVAKESSAICSFGECVIADDKIAADKNGKTVTITKKKYSAYDIYLGITQYSFVVADCQPNRYMYEFNKDSVKSETDIQTVTEDILLKDVGKCFRLADIQSCKVKNGFGGSVNCVVTMKNGSCFKLMFPGISEGSRYEEYRDAIVARLDVSNS